MNINPIIKVPVAELKTAIGGITKVIPRHNSMLPVLGMILIERDRQGWVYLSATDLDNFLTLRLEALGQNANPVKFLVPFTELQKLGKSCPADETIKLEPVSEERLILRHRIGSHPVEQVITSLPAADFPGIPEIATPSISLDEAARSTLLNALDCASEDETRFILNGAYLDVSKPGCHCVVATDGRHLFASNSLHLPLASSVLIPDHRFLIWSGFIKDGQWKLSADKPKKDTGGYLKVESRRWTFITKQVEGTYPNWRNITEDVREFSGSIEISETAAAEIQRIIPRLPGDDTPNHTVGLCVYGRKLFLRGWDKGQERATEVEVPQVTVSGNPATVYCDRQYLLKAIGFGLHTIGVQEPLRPLRFSDGGSRQMIVMPVRADADASMSSNNDTPASAPVNPITPAAASTDAMPDQPTTFNHNHNPQERNATPMQNGINNNGNSHQAAASTKPPRLERNPAWNRRSTRSSSSKAPFVAPSLT